jgi:hypothetical protein
MAQINMQDTFEPHGAPPAIEGRFTVDKKLAMKKDSK